MGFDKRIPLPAPTDSEIALTTTSVAVDDESSIVSNPGDEVSHYSLPDDGTPVTIRTRGHRPNKSQTSLLIEYFEGGQSAVDSGSGSRERRPSVRVRVTPSRGRSAHNDHIQITEMSSRKASHHRGETDSAISEDARSLHSYASATEESNVSRNPIEVDIEPGHRRRRKPSSPLIPAADSKTSSYIPPNMSDISGIPTDSFLDGTGPNTSFRKDNEIDRSAAKNEARAVGALGTAAAILTDKSSNRSSRSDAQDRNAIQKAVDRAGKPERKSKSKVRSSVGSEKDFERLASPRRKSRSTPRESLISGADSSVMSSQLTGSQRSYDSYSSSKISINNPKLLETVEDAIRRLILPELDAIKRERSQRDSRRPKDRDSFSSLTSAASREEISVASKRKSADTSHSTKSKTSRGREARNDLSPQSSADDVSIEEDLREEKTPRQHDRGKDALAGAAIGAGALAAAAALRSPSRGDNKRERRRRRADPTKRDSYTDDYGDAESEVAPPMPLSSELNPSEMTRTSIQSADSHRPHSASEEMTPVQEVNRGVAAMESSSDVATTQRTPSQTTQALGTLHHNISHGDLKNLPRRGTMDAEELEEEELRTERTRDQGDYYDDYDDEGRLAEPGMYDDEEDRLQQAYYGHQDVPAPLRYVPYQQERRGLSPIQSVSGFTEGGDSEYQGHRDSRIAPTDSELSASPEKSRGVWSPSSVPSNMRSREFNDEGSSVLSSGVGYRQSAYTEDSELDHPGGRAVHVVGDNPQMIHRDSGPESAVASLVDGSQWDPSLLSGTGGHAQDYRNSQYSYSESPSQDRLAQGSPLKHSVDAEQVARGQTVSPISTAADEPSTVSQNFVEYDLDEYGRKVPQSQYRHSPTASESAITSAALRQAAAEALKRKNVAQDSTDVHDEEFVGEGVSRNKSFKERARGNFELAATPKHSTDRLSDYDQPKMSATGLPDMGHPMPEIGYGYDDGQHSRQQTPSIVEGHPGERYMDDDREGAWTPTQEATHNQYDRSMTPKASESGGPPFFGATDAAAAATIATATALAAAHHKREPSQDQDDEWQRTSGDRKRDTLVTNPYEGASPIANLPGLDGLQGGGYGANAYSNFNTGSPGLPAGDEGYISSAPNELRNNAKGNGVDFAEQPRAGPSEDPFYSTPKPQRQMSGLSQGVGSPLYDASTGNGIDRIQSKDIIALMEHLMVRDAQRSARDTEMLVTLVRSAAEMRNSFEDIKRMLADTEDQIITEIKDNTEQTVKRHLGGPRPFPGSSPRSIQDGSQAGTMDEVAKKKRSFLRRALQGLGNKGASDLGRIEDMLMQLLTDVDVLKHQTAGPNDASPGAQSMRSIEQQDLDGQFEDRGYEPEGRAGTSTASYASQSGALSIGKNSGRIGHDRKVSDNRISTVPEGNEEEYDDTYVTAAHQYSPQQQGYFSPAPQQTRGGSVPLGTPPQSSHRVPNSLSNENTPRTEDGKKHKSRGSATFFPKISRWSETTTSSIGKVFRNSNNTKKNPGEPPEDFLQHPASRSGSVDEYDQQYQYDNYGQDKLHSGFSEHDLSANVGAPEMPQSSFGNHGPPPASYASPEDPKYKAHRNSLNLQHPQPRPGQTERFRTALESSAQVYDGPMSPNSAEWAGSATSLHRFPEQNTNRYSDNSALTGQTGDSYSWQQSPAPPRPPKEPLEGSPLAQVHSPPQNSRVSHMQRTSPMPYASAVDSGYGTGSATHAGSWHSGSPKPENKNLSTALGVPTRRPSGPRAMTPTNESDNERRRKRDTFGSVPARPSSAASQETDTF